MVTMSHDPEEQGIASPSGAGEPEGEARRPGSALPPPVQEHLAQQLRAAYQMMAEKPAFLGDPALPPEFDRQIAQLEERERSEMRERAHNLGIEAVEAALRGVASGTAAPEGSPPGSRASPDGRE